MKFLPKNLRSLLVSLLVFFSFAFLGEFVVGPFMGDSIPLWKILAVSLVSSFMTVVPLQRRGLSHGDVFKYFHRSFFYPAGPLHKMYMEIIEAFPAKEFKVQLLKGDQEIKIRRKATWQSFGEVIHLKSKDTQIDVWVRPKYYLDLFDQGQAFESLNRIESIIQKQIQHAS